MILIRSYRVRHRWHKNTLVAVLIAASVFFSVVCNAQGEHARRIAAELTVLLGDIRMLASAGVVEQQNSGLHVNGLLQRIEGGLVALDILARLADQETNRPTQSRFDFLVSLPKALKADRLDKVEQALSALLIQYPLVLPDIQFGQAPADISEFADLHQSLCAGCHDYPDLTVDRPAYNLTKQSTAVSEIEMFARMLVGVRGDRVTGIDNPLTDRQIMGLLFYYKNRQEI